MLRGKVKTIILDIDETLSKEVSWYKLTEGLGASKTRHELIFDLFKNGKLTYEEARNRLVKLWMSTGNANKKYMKKMFQSWKLRKDASDVVTYLNKHYRLCLISGSVDLYVQVVSEKLNVKDWYANTKLVWNDKGNLVNFHYTADQAQMKLLQFKEYIKKNQIQKNKCAVVGNGDSDIILFKELKYGIEVNKIPNPDLKSLSFKTAKSLLELKNIF